MKVEGNFSDEKESNNMKDFKPSRPVINRWYTGEKTFTFTFILQD